MPGGAHEIEEDPRSPSSPARLDGDATRAGHARVQETPDGTALTGWPSLDRPPASLLLFADPFTFPVGAFLRVNRDLPGLQIIGGLASALRKSRREPPRARRWRRRRGSGRCVRRRRQHRRGPHARVTGLPTNRPPVRRRACRAEPHRGARRAAAERSRLAGGLGGGSASSCAAACTSGSSWTSTKPKGSAGATSSSGTCSAPTRAFKGRWRSASRSRSVRPCSSRSGAGGRRRRGSPGDAHRGRCGRLPSCSCNGPRPPPLHRRRRRHGREPAGTDPPGGSILRR